MPVCTALAEQQDKAASGSHIYTYCRAVVFHGNHQYMTCPVLFLFLRPSFCGFGVYQFRERVTLVGFCSPAIERYGFHHQQEGYWWHSLLLRERKTLTEEADNIHQSLI